MNPKKKSRKITKLIQNAKQLRSRLESNSKEIIIGTELIHHQDSFHYLRAGLDQILCKIAKNNNKTIAFSFKQLKQIADPLKQARLLSRMQQNMFLCQKFQVKTSILDTSSNSLKSAFYNLIKTKK
jgi:hypothetical protein